MIEKNKIISNVVKGLFDEEVRIHTDSHLFFLKKTNT